MGLLDEAVAEFDKAVINPARRVGCLTLKGICLTEKGSPDLAEEAFKSAMAHPGLNDGERISLLYELGLLYEGWNKPLEALDSFQSVADADLFFRDVGEKVEALRKKLGLDAGEEDGESGPKGDKNRVSYV
jgi:tetratricopeptide (TPR) repeat protein